MVWLDLYLDLEYHTLVGGCVGGPLVLRVSICATKGFQSRELTIALDLGPSSTHPPWFLVVLSICFLLVVRSNPGGTGLSRPFLSDPPISLGPQPISTNSKQFQISNEENYLKFSHLHHPTSISGLMVRLRSVPDNLEWKIKSWDFASS